ncbi:MAG: hypothetical protein U9O56_08725 [Campylobacterota bacterium]|nr:hypothetical protein [Campylobacterota bacterium]
MSSYSRLGFIFILLSITLGCAKQPSSNLSNQKEDLLVLLANDSQNQSQYKKSSIYYEELFNLTNNTNYLKKTIALNFEIKNYKKMENLSIKAIKKFPKQKEYYIKQLIISQISQNNLDTALRNALKLLTEFSNSQNYEIVANVYYAQKDFKNSVKYYESAYALDKNEETLIKLTTILYTYLNKKDVALAYLETYLQTKSCSSSICDRLMLIYQEQGNINGMLSILKKMHIMYKKNPELKKTVLLIENIIISLLEKKDINKAIKFLEDNKTDKIKLLNLYYQNGQLKQALNLTRKLYKKSRNPELLGRIAMIEFELADDKKDVMKHVIANFDLALSSGINNASYQNYYAYLLIDYDINIKKGVSLVKQALKTAPNNIAYLDTLAWGYYKLGRCDEALKVMKNVIDKTGLKDQELNMHWNKINNCKRKK